jgi:hypothetical protein
LATVRERWQAVAEAVRPHSRGLWTLLADKQGFAVPVDVTEDNQIVIHFKYQNHMSKLEDTPNRIAVERALRRVLGVDATISCVLVPRQTDGGLAQGSMASQNDPLVLKAQRMLGGRLLTRAEVAALESLPEMPLPGRDPDQV